MNAKIIARLAISKNGYIGNSQNPPLFLPWGKDDLPGDLKRFKEDTVGYPIIMGRKTAQTFGGRPLPNRVNIYISDSNDWEAPEGFIHFKSLAQAVQTYEHQFDKIFVIGGARLIEHALEHKNLDEMILTITHKDFPGDVKFPEWDKNEWKEIDREPYPEFGYDIVHFKRLVTK